MSGHVHMWVSQTIVFMHLWCPFYSGSSVMPIPMVSKCFCLPDLLQLLWIIMFLEFETALPLSTYHPQLYCLNATFCWYHQLPLSILSQKRAFTSELIAMVTSILMAVGSTGALNEGLVCSICIKVPCSFYGVSTFSKPPSPSSYCCHCQFT